MALSDKLKALRAKNNMTQQKLADELGVQRSTVAQYESGRISPSGNVLKSLALIFSVSVDMLLQDSTGIEENDISAFLCISTGSSYIDSIIKLSAKSLMMELAESDIEQFSNNRDATYRFLESLLFFNYYAVKNKQKVLLVQIGENAEKMDQINRNIQNFINQIIQTEKIYNLMTK